MTTSPIPESALQASTSSSLEMVTPELSKAVISSLSTILSQSLLLAALMKSSTAAVGPLLPHPNAARTSMASIETATTTFNLENLCTPAPFDSLLEKLFELQYHSGAPRESLNPNQVIFQQSERTCRRLVCIECSLVEEDEFHCSDVSFAL